MYTFAVLISPPVRIPEGVVGLYITGSVARKETDELSDFDVIAIIDGDVRQEEIADILGENAQVNVLRLDELKKEVREDPTIALMIKEAIPVKPLSDIEEHLSFTEEDVIRAITRTARELLEMLKISGRRDSGIFLAMMYARKLYTLRCMLLGKRPTKQEFLEELKEYHSGIEEIYGLKKRIEKGDAFEVSERDFREFLKAVVDYASDLLRSLH